MKKTFPRYYKNLQSTIYYKVSSEKVLEEVQLIGQRCFYIKVMADKYPEMMLIRSFLNLEREGVIEGSFADTFETLSDKAKK